jgi:Ca2+-binding RTX toxin-like protein
MALVGFIVAALAALAQPAVTRAETLIEYVQATKLIAPSGNAGDQLGFSSAISADGNTIVVGAPFNDDGGPEFGAVYVYERPAGGWSAGAIPSTLVSSDGAEGDWFGFSVDVSADGRVISVGSPNVDGRVLEGGAVYVFVRPGPNWLSVNETAKLTTSIPGPYEFDFLGAAVGISGDGRTIIAGAYGYDNDNRYGSGAAFVFARQNINWRNATETAKLTGSDVQELDEFGRSVAISRDGNTIAVVKANGGAGGVPREAIYTFVKPSGGWVSGTEQAQLSFSDGPGRDITRQTVAVSGDGSTIVGVRNDFSSAAYVFLRPPGGWTSGTEQARLAPSSRITFANAAISDNGQVIAVGAPLQFSGGRSRGAVYLFERPTTGWASATESFELTASDRKDFDNFGASTALNNNGSLALGGATFATNGTTNTGAAYLFEARPLPKRITVVGCLPDAEIGGVFRVLPDPGTTLTATSSNQDLVPDSQLTFTPESAPTFLLTIRATPGRSGEALVTVTAGSGRGGTQVITVRVGTGGVLEGTPGIDLLIGSDGRDTLNGRDGDDVLCGRGGNDVLLGGNGDDALNGGAGNDTLNSGAGLNEMIGGPGADRFRFTNGGAGTILDFNPAEGDVIVQ